MSENNGVEKPSLESAPDYPHQGHSLMPLEQRLADAASIKPRVSIIDENGATEVTGAKIVSEEQLANRFNGDASFAEKNPEYTDLAKEIPSSMAFYPGNSLSIKTFRTPHIIKLIDAIEMEDLRLVVEAVSAVLEPSFSALDLTPEDFFYCMYWLKINSFKKHPYEVSYVCTNPAHHEKVLKKLLPEKSLHNIEIVKQVGQLTIEKLTPEAINRSIEILNQIKAEYGIDVFPMRMRDYLDLQGYLKRTTLLGTRIEELNAVGDYDSDELEEIKAKKREIDAQYALKDYAPYICLPDPKATVADKINYLNNLDLGPDFLMDLDEFIKSLSHGVKETAVVHCQECKAKVEINVSIEALHFFPEIIRRRLAN